MKKNGRPNGHSPKDPVIRMLTRRIKVLEGKQEELKRLRRTLSSYRKSVVAQRPRKRRQKAVKVKLARHQ